jgi:hypothetical protein
MTANRWSIAGPPLWIAIRPLYAGASCGAIVSRGPPRHGSRTHRPSSLPFSSSNHQIQSPRGSSRLDTR